ncbi:MAG TPA: hypothetical protein VLA52_05325 [Thermohalobaculum sp.]|nr:hypothetical protein [Thermohalobaculum sp.]
MNPSLKGRIYRGVAVGLAAASSFAVVITAVSRQDFAYVLGAALSLGILMPLFWLVLAPAAWFAAHQFRSIGLIDTAVATVTVVLVAQVILFEALLFNDLRGPVMGEKCNGGAGRILVAPQEKPGGPVYWSCVPAADIDVRKAALPVSPQSPVESMASHLSRLFDHMAQHNFALKSLVLGVVAALAGWLYAFGWRWRVHTDAL